MKMINLVINGRRIFAHTSLVDGKHFVAITPICEAIGIDSYTQARKLQNSPQFSPQHMLAPSAGGTQETWMLPIEEVGMWLCGINANRVNEDIRNVLLEFQKFCQMELWAAINGSAGIERVEKLEQQLAIVMEQNSKMLDLIGQQQIQINHLMDKVAPMANVEKHIASIGGKFMAVARGTKKMRDSLH